MYIYVYLYIYINSNLSINTYVYVGALGNNGPVTKYIHQNNIGTLRVYAYSYIHTCVIYIDVYF
jgi:hypothetical protein